MFAPELESADPFLRATLGNEYRRFQASGEDAALIERLRNWNDRNLDLQMTETQEESTLLSLFFRQTWGYHASGERAADHGFTCFPRFRIAGAGQTGGNGEADLALGWFGREDIPGTPQVLCEFKDIRSNLDAPQNWKGNTRSPVKQCADYLREVAKPLFGNEAIQPTWGIVTDMNEFRLYRRDTMPADYQRFVITPATTDDAVSLLADGEEASFQRFLFATLFRADRLLTTGGPCPLLQLLRNQRILEKEIENSFYREYKEYRERLYGTLVTFNPEFSGTRGKLVRHAQKLIDRCIFVMFAKTWGRY